MLGHVQQEERVLSAQPEVEQSCSYSRHTVCFFNFLLRASQKWSVLHLDLGDLDSGSNWETLASESCLSCFSLHPLQPIIAYNIGSH